jgi:hypothetical protein
MSNVQWFISAVGHTVRKEFIMRIISSIVGKVRRNASASKARRPRRCLFEALETRTLMSVTIVNAKTATFTDVDGDLVTVAVSKGTLQAGLFTTAASGLGEQLQQLDLTNAGFAGANLTISVKQAAVNPTGDGLTQVGFINCTGHAMGKVVVAGDLGRINGGAIAGLAVFSLGRQGLGSQGGSGNLTSSVGDLGALAVVTDIDQAFIDSAGSIGSVKVGGSLLGGTDAGSGSIHAAGKIGNVIVGQSLVASTDAGAAAANGSASIIADGGSMGNVTIGGSLIGGAAEDSGSVFADAALGKVVIGGSLLGGDGRYSAEVDAASIAGFSVAGSLMGGAGEGSGGIFADKIGNVYVGGSIIGGSGFDSGAVFSGGDLGSVTVIQNLIGGDSNSAAAFYTGYIEADGKMGSVLIGGNVVAGVNSGSGSLFSGSIRAGTTMGAVTIRGRLTGNATLDAIISAGGTSTPNGSTAINSITVLGSVTRGQFLAGYDVDLTPVNGGAGIGKVVIGGDWTASSILAGVVVGADNQAGTGDDTAITVLAPGKSKITSIVIAGQVLGTADAGDNFGFVASSIGSFSAAGVKAVLTAAKNIVTLGGTTDLVIREV